VTARFQLSKRVFYFVGGMAVGPFIAPLLHSPDVSIYVLRQLIFINTTKITIPSLVL